MKEKKLNLELHVRDCIYTQSSKRKRFVQKLLFTRDYKNAV